ncbi:type IV pilus secretin PilQ [Oceanicoccus sagamiensis]|uniref:Fimbrial protein n=1 Tax=Oceanicoccus sagamiensis TaxID=716816 RepID=A0A1X9N811_9GAMM|nr:type IV pilus secretin PilQ family protein [Oceanicoccus sagamiensis]ARN74208.1 fimbrial protein [Oceanicoccus sagamiensis]
MDIAYRHLSSIKGGRGLMPHRLLRTLSLVLCALFASMAFAADVNLTDVEFSSQPGGRFEVRLDFDGTPPEPKGYNIEKPARIALDMAGVSSKLEQKKFPLSYGNASSAVILESGGRTRMILNLVELAPYQTRIEGNSLFVEVGDSGVREYLKPTKENPVLSAASSKQTNAASNDIVDVDFKRGDQGEGRLVINLANPKAGINVFVEGGFIKVDFDDVNLPERLQRRYDVSDFATPVQSVEAQPSEGGALFSLKASGDFDYLAYQTDNEYVVSVKPLTAEELELKKKEFAYVGDKLSLNFQDIEVRAVLQLIADFTSLNLVASDTVSGRITLRLQNVPWDQALDLVLKTKGLDKRQNGNVLMVAPAAEIAERERQEIENNKQIEELAPLQTEYIRIRYADAREMYRLFGNESGGPEEVSTTSLLSPRGSVIVDERTNSLLVTETAQKLQEFRRVVRLLDVPVRQVLVEARIVIANSSFDEELGVQWGASGINAVNSGEDLLFFGGNTDSIIDSRSSVAQAALDIAQGNDLSEPILAPDALNVDLGVANPTGSVAVGFVNDDVILQMELNALESQGRGEIVSQPKVITGDKQEAVIKSGSEVPFQESSANGETTVSFKEAVLKLQVTPSITPDDRIIMTLEINQDSIGDLVPSGNGGVVPTIDTTELTTQVLVGNGETVVLGGVFRTVDVESESKVPVLGDIPYLGRLFTNTSVTQEKTETLIFITPRILADTLID